MKIKDAASFGIIGEPGENTAKMLGKLIGKPVKMRKKGNKTIFLIGKSIFKKKMVSPKLKNKKGV